MKKLTAILFTAAFAFTLGSVQAGEKGKEVTLEGVMSCEKCNLKTADSCSDALVVDDVTYHLEEKGERKTGAHVCSGTSEVKVTGTVEERDGEKFVVVSKIEKE